MEDERFSAADASGSHRLNSPLIDQVRNGSRQLAHRPNGRYSATARNSGESLRKDLTGCGDDHAGAERGRVEGIALGTNPMAKRDRRQWVNYSGHKNKRPAGEPSGPIKSRFGLADDGTRSGLSERATTIGSEHTRALTASHNPLRHGGVFHTTSLDLTRWVNRHHPRCPHWRSAPDDRGR